MLFWVPVAGLRAREPLREQPSECQERAKAWPVWEYLGHVGKGVVETPGRAVGEGGKTGPEVFLSNRRQQTQRQEPIDEGVIHQGLGSDVSDLGVSKVSHLRRVAVKVFQTAHDGGTEFGL